MSTIDTLTDEQLDEATDRRPPRAPAIIAAILVAVLLLVGGVVIGRFTAPTDSGAPANTSAEAGFARDMQVHHQQAVEMAMIAFEKTDDPAVRQLAYDIARTQGQQAGQMFGWLASWGLPQASPEPSMTWMTTPTLDGGGGMEMAEGMNMSMPGYASAADVDRLRAATGADADRLFLELMIAHHQGGVEMAQAVLDRSTEPTVTSLASSIVSSQQSEIEYMRELLAR